MLLQAACATVQLADFKTVESGSTQISGDKDRVTSLHELPLRSGQIVVSEAGSSMSFLMNLMASEYTTYGHAGILIREPDGFFVYEAFGFLNLQLWNPPTRRLHGKIRRVPLLDFLSRSTVAAIYEHSNIDLDAVATFARDSFENKLAFDGFFDLRTDSQVYCSEFVARALEAGGHEPMPATSRTANPSLLRTMEWLELDAPAYLLAGHLVRNADEIARFSRNYTASQLQAHFSFEQGLHQRFDAQQSLGNIFRWTAAGPRYRRHLTQLKEELVRHADHRKPGDIDHWVRAEMDAALSPRSSASQASLSDTQ